MKKIAIYIVLIISSAFAHLIAAPSTYTLQSPDKKISILISTDSKITWSVEHQKTTILAASTIGIELKGGEDLGKSPKLISSKFSTVDETFATPIYKKQSVRNNYNQLLLIFKGEYSLEFRAFNDGVAYRFLTNRKDSIVIENEIVNFNFYSEPVLRIPFVTDLREKTNYHLAFEALYDKIRITEISKDTVAFLPFLTEFRNGKKACFLEADLEEYPGMFIRKESEICLKGVFAMYPKKERQGGFANLNRMVTERENYMVATSGARTFPWRAIVISEHDKELTNNDMVQKLAAPSRIKETSWIKPGKVAWDWWNDWNISKVDFVAGVNTATYKYYIDFASNNKIEYVVLDEGWSNDTSLLHISDKMNIEELVEYGKKKNVGIILWASWYAAQKDMLTTFDKYSKMGVKGFKIDFIDRDDAKMVSSLYKIAKAASDYKLLIDYHGMYKPTGIQRTFPNILNFEGVKGLENSKWAPNDNVPLYDVTIPFIRMVAGPMDYTPGAMRNASRGNFSVSNSNPMSHGTRVHQMAMYTVFEAPLQMLADNPTAYMKEQECTDFIAQIPTVFDETVALDGKVGEYVAVARKKATTWYVGALTNWDARNLELDLSFLGDGTFEAEIVKDGLNASKEATDYKKEKKTVTSMDKLKITMAPGGGWTAIIRKK